MSDRARLFSPRAGERGMDDLQFAAYCGDLAGVRALLADGADPRTTDDFGYTALHWNARMACAGRERGGREGIVAALIGAGADINARDNEGNTVLANAIEATAPASMIRLLKSNGAV